MKREQERTEALTQVAHMAADFMSKLLDQNNNVLLEDCLNRVGSPLDAALVEREWLRKYRIPGMPAQQELQSLRSMQIASEDLVDHLGPRWILILDRLDHLIKSDYEQFIETSSDISISRYIDIAEYRGGVSRDASEVASIAAEAGMEAEWENSVMLATVISQYHSSKYLTKHYGNGMRELNSEKANRAELLMTAELCQVFKEGLAS